MILTEFQDRSLRPLTRHVTVQEDLEHMQDGILTELGELLDVFKKHINYKKDFDFINAKEECGDILFYTVNICNILGYQLNDSLIVQREQAINTKEARRIVLRGFAQAGMMFDYNMPTQGQVEAMILTVVNITDYLGLSMSSVFERNVEKLALRYKDKFTPEEAEHRNLEAELAVLSK